MATPSIDGVDNRSVWVSNLNPPIVTADLAKYFSRVGEVEDVFVPEDESEECLVVFRFPTHALSALSYNKKPYRDRQIIVTEPTASQVGMALPPEYGTPLSSSGQSPGAILKQVSSAIDYLEDSDIMLLMEQLKAIALGRLNKSKQNEPVKTLFETRPNSNSSSTPQMGNPPSTWNIPTTQYPRVVFFSGDTTKAEHGSYFQWRNEVRALVADGFPQPYILQAVRRSVKGPAAEALINLGPSPTTTEILEKFDVVFGVALSSEALVQSFYACNQRAEKETVAAWGCRLESLLSQAKDKGIVTGDADEMLRSRFWSGLKNLELKNALRHRFDGGQSFTQLMLAARAVEQEDTPGDGRRSHAIHVEEKTRADRVVVKAQQAELSENKMETLIRQMDDISARLNRMEDDRGNNRTTTTVRGRGRFYCHKDDHLIRDCPARKAKEAKGEDQDKKSGNG